MDAAQRTESPRLAGETKAQASLRRNQVAGSKSVSPQEPFLVLVGDSALAVRGTDFAVHVERKVAQEPEKISQFVTAGTGPMDPFRKTYFIEAYTFEGEVHLATRLSDLRPSGKLPREVVRILPGQFSNLWSRTGPMLRAEDLEPPQPARPFETEKLSLTKWFPAIPEFSNNFQSPTYQVLHERLGQVLHDDPHELPAQLEPASQSQRSIASEKPKQTLGTPNKPIIPTVLGSPKSPSSKQP